MTRSPSKRKRSSGEIRCPRCLAVLTQGQHVEPFIPVIRAARRFSGRELPRDTHPNATRRWAPAYPPIDFRNARAPICLVCHGEVTAVTVVPPYFVWYRPNEHTNSVIFTHVAADERGRGYEVRIPIVRLTPAAKASLVNALSEMIGKHLRAGADIP